MKVSKFWLNVDFDPREYSCRLHRDDCRFILRTPTPYKGIGELKRDGGWLFFETVEEAKAWHRDKYPEISWKPCKFCKPTLNCVGGVSPPSPKRGAEREQKERRKEE